MNMNMNMDMKMFLNKMCCRYLFSCEIKKRETTDAGSRFYALHQYLFPPPLPPQKHD